VLTEPLEHLHLRVLLPSTGTMVSETAAAVALNLAHVCMTGIAKEQVVGINTCESSMLPLTRTIPVKEALKAGATHLIFVDSDMDFAPETFTKLILHDLPLVGVNYIRKKPPHTPVTIGMDGLHRYTREESTGLEEVLHTGFGVMCMKAEIFKDFPQPWFPMGWDDKRQEYIGEDTFFFHMCRKRGFKAYIDHDLSKKVGHWGGAKWTYDLAPDPVTEEEIAEYHRRQKAARDKINEAINGA